MTTTNTDDERPIGAIDRLPRSIEPARDLWPDIRDRLPSRQATSRPVRRGWGLRAVAATVAVAFVAGLLIGRQGPAPESGPPLTLAEAAAPAMAGALEATEREYRAAYKGFETVGVAPSLLEPRTVEDLESSWQSMKQAETALKTALEEYPDNPYLAEKLLDLRGQQLEFMRQLHLLDQNSRRNT